MYPKIFNERRKRTMKKIFTVLLSLVMMLSLSLTAFAADEAGSGSIVINGKTEGHTYEAYQIFSGTSSDTGLVSVTWGSGVNGDQLLKKLGNSDFAGCTSAQDVATVLEGYGDDSDKIEDFAKTVASCLTETKTTSTANGTTYTISDLQTGYYFVKDKDESISENAAYTKYILKVVEGQVTVNSKDSQPTLDKQIKHNESKEWGNVGDNQIGDTVEFRTITTVPDVNGYTEYKYIISDTMSAELTSNVKSNQDVTIKVNDTTELDSQYYTVGSNGNSFTVTVDIMNAIADGKMAAGDTLYTYYTGVLNENAKIYDEGKQQNTAHLEYSNNPNDTSSKGKTPDKTVYDWTFKMGVKKVDKAGNALTGAKFVLSKNGSLNLGKIDENGVPANTNELISLIENNGTYTVAPNGYTGTTYVITAGSITIKGLDDATDYYLYETKAPDNYNRLTSPVKFKITASTESYGNAGDHTPTVTVAVNDGEASNTISTNVVNNKGAVLPSTGSMGVKLFYALGSVLFVGAAVLLVTKKRMKNMEN